MKTSSKFGYAALVFFCLYLLACWVWGFQQESKVIGSLLKALSAAWGVAFGFWFMLSFMEFGNKDKRAR